MSGFDSIVAKVKNGDRLSNADALLLFEHPDLIAVGELAALANERRNGRRVFFNVNRHINHTNICVNRCRFCAFSKTADEPGAYCYDMDEIRNRALEAAAQGATEIHIVGGLHPELPFEFYLEMLTTIREAAPALHIKAFTAVEIEYLARLAGLSIAATLDRLKETGLGSLPGGGAEILGKEVRDQLCPEKISGEEWLAVMREVHRSGLKSNATMLYGHVESHRDRVDHMSRLRQLQDKSLPELLKICREVLGDHPLFVVLTVYAVRSSAIHFQYALEEMLKGYGGTVDCGELVTEEKSAGHLLSQAVYARWGV